MKLENLQCWKMLGTFQCNCAATSLATGIRNPAKLAARHELAPWTWTWARTHNAQCTMHNAILLERQIDEPVAVGRWPCDNIYIVSAGCQSKELLLLLCRQDPNILAVDSALQRPVHSRGSKLEGWRCTCMRVLLLSTRAAARQANNIWDALFPQGKRVRDEKIVRGGSQCNSGR